MQMQNRIQFKRGNKANLPTLNVGEPAICTDTNEVYIGTTGSKVIELAKQSDIDSLNTSLSNKINSINFYNATCAYTTNLFTLTLTNSVTTKPNYYSVLFKATNDWVAGSSFKIGTKAYTPVNASFSKDEIVLVNFDETTSKCFFKSGVTKTVTTTELTETLPQQVDSFSGICSTGVVTLSWSNSNTNYLSGYYIVYKTGSVPATINDGTKITASSSTASVQVSGLTDGVQYYFRIYPYNSKFQVQAEYKITNVTPTSGIALSSLSVCSKLKVTGDNGVTSKFIIVDKNHSGYPSNTFTFMSEDCVTSMQQKTASDYSGSTGDVWLQNSYPSYLPSRLKSYIPNTTINANKNRSINQYTAIQRQYFLPSYIEIKTTHDGYDTYDRYGGVRFAYIPNGTSDYWNRTIDNNSDRYSAWDSINNREKQNQDSSSVLGIRPVFNVYQTADLKVTSQPDSQGYYVLL
jgi:hypothetical protein